jgi:antitoxin PrlF
MTESKITAAGQTTIPAVIRQHLELRAGDKLRYFIEGERVLLVPARKSLKRLKGRLPKPAKTVTTEEMNDAITSAACETMSSQ